MAIAYRSSATGSTGAGTAASVVVNLPAGTVDGDVLIAAFLDRQASATKVQLLSGWTEIRNDPFVAPVAFLTSFYKVASSEPSSYTWTMSPNANCSGGIAAYSGVDTTTPIDVTGVGQVNASSTSVTAPAITPTSANVLLVFVGGLGGSTSPTWTPPGSMNERFEAVNSAANIVAVELADEVYNNPGVSTGTRVATASAAAVNAGQLIALRPASGGSPVTISAPTATATADAQVPVILGADVDPGVPISYGPIIGAKEV